MPDLDHEKQGARQFLVSVEPSPEGYEATCQAIEAPDLDAVPCGYNLLRLSISASKSAGQGATEVAACLAALAQAHLGQPIASPRP